MAPMSPKWLAMRSSSAISARSQTRARRRLDAERGLDGAGEGERVGDGAVARDAAGEPAPPRSRSAPAHQPLDALVHVAEPLLEAHHGLAVGGEAEMAGLDDAGVHRADRDLVQALALDRQERVGRRRAAGVGRARRAARGRPRRRGRARAAGPARRRREAEQVADRALQPDRRRMDAGRPTGNAPSRMRRLSDGDLAAGLVAAAPCAPASGSPHRPSRSPRPSARRPTAARQPVVRRRAARPGPMRRDWSPSARRSAEASARSWPHPSSARDVLEPGAPAAPAGRCPRPAPARDGRTAARRRPRPAPCRPPARRTRGPAGAAAARRTPTSRPSTSGTASSGCAREGRADHQELAHEDAERRQAGDRHDAEHQAPAEQRMASRSGRGCRRSLRALDLRDVADARRRSPTWSGCAWSCAAGRRSWRAARPCRRRR